MLAYSAVIGAGLLALGRVRIVPMLEGLLLFVAYYFTIHALAQAHSRYRLPVMPFVIVLASLWLADPRRPEGRGRMALVGGALVAFTALSVHYVVTVLP